MSAFLAIDGPVRVDSGGQHLLEKPISTAKHKTSTLSPRLGTDLFIRVEERQSATQPLSMRSGEVIATIDTDDIKKYEVQILSGSCGFSIY